jgi:CrcB protein
MNVIVVFVGGGIGAAARYLMQGFVYKYANPSFPTGTLIVNILGSFVIGLLMTSLEDRFLVTPELRLFLTVGILGGFTTFSSFSFETITLMAGGNTIAALANVGLSVVLCLGATAAGVVLGRII